MSFYIASLTKLTKVNKPVSFLSFQIKTYDFAIKNSDMKILPIFHIKYMLHWSKLYFAK